MSICILLDQKCDPNFFGNVQGINRRAFDQKTIINKTITNRKFNAEGL